MSKKDSKSRKVSYEDLDNKYTRSVIKLGNSKAITFPQEWVNFMNIKEGSKIFLHKIDKLTMAVRASEVDEKMKTFTFFPTDWPPELIRKTLIGAFKLNVDEVYIKYNEKNENVIFMLLTQLKKEIVGIDFRKEPENKEFKIQFLIDTSRKSIKDVIIDLINIFERIIDVCVEGNQLQNYDYLKEEIESKYSLGTRILITGLQNYVSINLISDTPHIIQYLGHRIGILYLRDLIQKSLDITLLKNEALIKRYTKFLKRIPQFLKQIIDPYFEAERSFERKVKLQNELISLNQSLERIENKDEQFEQELRRTCEYYLKSLDNFLDIAVTRVIESEIGLF